MAEWDDVRRFAMALPEAREDFSREHREWRVKEKLFAWERPLRKGDIAALGAAAPAGPILAVRVADVGVKDALVSTDPRVYFTTPHFDGYPAILVRLDEIDVAELEELLTDAWVSRAPKRLAAAFLESSR